MSPQSVAGAACALPWLSTAPKPPHKPLKYDCLLLRAFSSCDRLFTNCKPLKTRRVAAQNSPKNCKNVAAPPDAPRPLDPYSRVGGAPSLGDRRVNRSGGDGCPVGVLADAPQGERRRFPRRGLARGEQVPRKCHLIGPGALLGPGFVFFSSRRCPWPIATGLAAESWQRTPEGRRTRSRKHQSTKALV